MATCVSYITEEANSVLSIRTSQYLDTNPTCKLYREDVTPPNNTIVRFLTAVRPIPYLRFSLVFQVRTTAMPMMLTLSLMNTEMTQWLNHPL